MSGPLTLGANALGANPYITKLGAQGGKDSGLTIQPVQPYKGNNPSSIQNTSAGSPTLGTGIASAVQNLPNTIQQAQKLMQWRQQMNGGLFSQGQSNYVPPMNSDAGGVWAGNPTESQVGPATPAPDASAGVNMNATVGGNNPVGGSDPGGSSGMMGGMGGGSGMGMAGIGSAIGSSIAAPIEKSGQEQQKIASNLKPDINVQDPLYPIPQVGGSGLVV